jgi:hypothetical protein
MPKTDESVSSASVVIAGSKIVVSSPSIQTISYERVSYPQAFVEWQSKSRIEMFQNLAQAGAASVHSQPSHLPVLATLGTGEFPINLASRGIGLLPKFELLEKYIALLVSAKNKESGKKWQESLPARVNAMSQFYSNKEEIDTTLLGGLEIFEGKTAKNVRSNPLVSLLYTGKPPQYPSFQFNCIAEILPPEDLRFQFLLAARELFAFDAFHITQSRYPFGYAFHIVEILEKTPYPRG